MIKSIYGAIHTMNLDMYELIKNYESILVTN